jgi:hypothetical protein
MPTPITSALESKPDLPDGSATGFLGTPARKTATWGIFDLEFKHSVAEARFYLAGLFRQLMKTQSVSLDEIGTRASRSG